jgi:hypothetical protein
LSTSGVASIPITVAITRGTTRPDNAANAAYATDATDATDATATIPRSIQLARPHRLRDDSPEATSAVETSFMG